MVLWLGLNDFFRLNLSHKFNWTAIKSLEIAILVIAIKEANIAFGSACGSNVVGTRATRNESFVALRRALESSEVVLWHFGCKNTESLVHHFLTGVGFSCEDPGILDVEHMWDADASVNHGIVLIIGLENFVVSSWLETHKLDLEVALVFGWVNNSRTTNAAAPLALFVDIIIIQDSHAAVLVH